MILPDTSIWIEFFRGRNPYFQKLKGEIENRNVMAAEWVFGELLQGAKNQGEVKLISEYWENLPHPEIRNIWIEAGRLSWKSAFISKGVGLIDAALVASARKFGTPVWTLDRKLRSVLATEELYEP